MATNGAGRRVANRYELTEELGHGGMGVVWRATDTLLGRQVALKEVDLPRGGAGDRESLRARVTREARAAARLSHPGVVTVYDIAHDGDRDFIVMELVSAPTLEELVRSGGPLLRRGRPGSGSACWTRSRRPIGPGSSTATSSRRTSWSARTAPPSWPTSASPRSRATPG